MNIQFKKYFQTSLVVASLAAGLTACSKNDDKAEDNRAIKPTEPTELTVDGFRTARLYKGAWRPTISCKSKVNATNSVVVDLWENTLTLKTENATGVSTSTTFTSPSLIGQPLGTDRTWSLLGLPQEIVGSSSAVLKVDRYGHGYILSRRSGLTCSNCGDMVPRFECEEAAVPYEQKFVQAACDGDASFVDNFMTRYPNVSDYINQIGVIGETALTCALKNNRSSVIEVLINKLDSGLDFAAGNLGGEMPLFIDMDGAGRYSAEWQRRSDVDLSRVDGRHRTILHTKNASISTLRSLLASPRFAPAILNVESNLRTTALGSLIQKHIGSSAAIEAFELAKTKTTVEMERPAIERLTYLEYAIKMGSGPMARYFLAEKSQQTLPSGLVSPNTMVMLAASSCDLEFVKLLDQRRDIDFATTSGGENAIDVVRRIQCVNADQLVEAFGKRGVPDRLDPVVPACAGDTEAFRRALSNGALIGSKTARVMACIWNRPNMMQYLVSYPSLSWDWTVIDQYATKAFESKDANLIALYLNQIPWSSSSPVYSRMRDAVNSQQITVSQYYDALAAHSAMSDSNMRMGPYGHLVFSLIADGDVNRVAQYTTSVSASYWPKLDLTNQAGAQDYYANEYKDLVAANGCGAMPKFSETLGQFALRLGKGDVAKQIAGRMRSQSADFGSVGYSCNSSTNIYLMNLMSLAIKQCQTGVVSQAYQLGTRTEGAGENKFVRRNNWDVLARSKCSTDVVRALAGELYNTVGAPDELVVEGQNVSVVNSYLVDKGYSLKSVLTQYSGLSQAYPANGVVQSGSEYGAFNRTDKKVIGGTQFMLKKIRESGTLSDYKVEKAKIISFAGLTDYVSFYYPDYYKKNGCLIIVDSYARLNMKDTNLTIEKITVCQTSLRFKFNPTTSETALPIKNHVNGDFTYSLEGLDEASNSVTGEN